MLEMMFNYINEETGVVMGQSGSRVENLFI